MSGEKFKQDFARPHWGVWFKPYFEETQPKSCHKCGEEAQPDTDPPMCSSCLANQAMVKKPIVDIQETVPPENKEE